MAYSLILILLSINILLPLALAGAIWRERNHAGQRQRSERES
jgi:hypothetical protein